MSIIDESRQGVIAENSVGGSFEPLNGGYLVTLVVGTRLTLNLILGERGATQFPTAPTRIIV